MACSSPFLYERMTQLSSMLFTDALKGVIGQCLSTRSRSSGRRLNSLHRTIGHLVLFVLVVLPLSTGVLAGDRLAQANPSQNVYMESSIASITRGPTVHMVTNQSAVLLWKTCCLTNATVEYGLNVSIAEKVSNSTPDVTHRITLTGLEEGRTYYYKVTSNDTSSDIYNFKTAPADGEPFKMVVFGDNRPDTDTYVQPSAYSQIIDMVIAEAPDIVVMTGDYVYSVTNDLGSNELRWSAFLNVTERLAHYVPIYAAVGNHDTGLAVGSPMINYFLDAFEQFGEPSTCFSFDYAGVHFVILDSEVSGPQGRITGSQSSWLTSDLMSSESRMKLVFVHRPLYPLSHIGSSLDVNKTERDGLQQLFESVNVTLFVAGHDHLYNRMTVNGVVHLITGGAGAPLYGTPWGGAFNHYLRVGVSPSLVNITAIGLNSETMDNYKLPYQGPIEIFLRAVANNTVKQAGTMPEIYFSEVPVSKIYSWDGGTNMTTLTGLPGVPGQHRLDVYADNSDGVWSHARFVWTTYGSTTTTSTTTTQPADYTQVLVIVGLAGVAAVVLIVIVLRRPKTS